MSKLKVLLLLLILLSCNSQQLSNIDNLISQRQFDIAAQKINNAVTRINSKDNVFLANIYYLEGKLYSNKFEHNKAIESLDKAVYYCYQSKNKDLLLEVYDLLTHNYYRCKQLDKCQAVTDSLIMLSRQYGNKKAEGRGLSRLATCFVARGKDSATIEIGVKALEIGQELQDNMTIGTANLAIGVSHYLKENRKIALEYFEKSLAAYKQANYSFGIAQTNLNIGSCLEEGKDLSEALNAYKEGIEYASIIANKEQLMKLYHNIGVVYTDMQKHADALYALEQSAKYSQDNNDPLFRYRNLKALGNISFIQKDYPRCMAYLQEALKIDVGKQLKVGDLVNVRIQIGNVYVIQNKYTAAEQEFKKAEEIALHFRDTSALILADLGKAELFLKTQDYTNAISLCQKSIQSLNKKQDKYILNKIYKILYEANKGIRNDKAALLYYETHVAFKDTMLNESKLFEFGKLQAQIDYQQDKLQTQNHINLLNTQLAIKKQRNNFTLLFCVMLLFFSIVLVYAYLKIKASKQTLLLLNQTISQKNELVELQNKALAQSNEEIIKQNKLVEQQNKELEKSNEKIIKQNELLAQSNDNLLNFANMAAHDIKAPLRTIQSFTSIIYKRYKSLVKESDQQLFDFVINSCKDLSNLIQVLLQFSKTTESLPQTTHVNINTVVSNVLSNLKVNIEETNTILQVAQNLPIVEAHETLIQQLFLNLIANSIKYRNEEITNVVSIEKIDMQYNYICIAVKDNGIGIPKNVQSRIFDLFSKYHTSPKHEGYGIGLSTCKKIIDYYGGKIWVESEVGEGTTFYFTLKLP